MNNVLSNIRSLPGDLWSRIAPSGPSRADKALSTAVGTIFAKKEALIESSLADKKRRFHPVTGSCFIQVFHDVVTAMFVVFTVIKVALPSIAALTPIVIGSAVFGGIGGILNLAMGFVTLREGIQAIANGDKAKGIRLLIISAACIGIGLFMLVSTITAFVALGGVAAFIAANPWILPVLILGIYIPLLYEILRDNKSIFTSQDPFSKLQVDQIDALLKKDIINWPEIKKLLSDTDLNYETVLAEFNKNGLKSLSERMEVLQSKIGPRGAVASFKLFQSVLDQNRQDTQKHIKELRGLASHWKRSQHIRLFQQVLYIGSFVLSMLALKGANPRMMETVDNSLMLVGMGIPIYMDALWPFLRNVPIIVPKVEVE